MQIPWGFQHRRQSKTDWRFSEIWLSFIRFSASAKDFNRSVTVPPQHLTRKVVQKWGLEFRPLQKLFLKKRGRHRRGTFEAVFDTCTKFWEYWEVAQIKALREGILKHPWKVKKGYLKPKLLAVEKKLILTRKFERNLTREDLTFIQGGFFNCTPPKSSKCQIT